MTDLFKAFIIIFAGAVVNTLLYFSLNTLPMDMSTTRIIQSFMVIISTFLMKRVFDIVLFMPLETRRKQALPRWLKHFAALFLLLIAVTIIVVHIYQQPFMSIATFSGLIGAGFAISVQSIVVDFFSGLTQDVERNFDVGDWLKFEGDKVLKVQKIGWRSTTFLSLLNTTITIPNSRLNDRIENLSRPGPFMFEYLEVVLDHDIPIERACRLLEGAVHAMPNNRPDHVYVAANKINEGGIIYLVIYSVKNIHEMVLLKNDIFAAIINHLRRYDLSISESLGAYIHSPAVNNVPIKALPRPDLILEHAPLFKSISAALKKDLMKSLSVEHHSVGTILFEDEKTDEHIYMIAEGTVGLYAALPSSHQPKETEEARLVRYYGLGELLGYYLVAHHKNAHVYLKAETSVVSYRLPSSFLKKILNADRKVHAAFETTLLETHKTLHHTLQQELDAEKTRETIKSYLKSLLKEVVTPE